MRVVSHIVQALVFFLAASSASFATQREFEEPPKEYEEPVDEWVSKKEKSKSEFFRGRFRDRYADLLEIGDVHGVVLDLVKRFDERDWGSEEPSQQVFVAWLQRFSVAVGTASTAPGIQGVLDEAGEQSVFLAALDTAGFGLSDMMIGVAQDPSGSDVSAYFVGTPDEFLLYVWNAAGDAVIPRLTPKSVREWRLLEDALTHLLRDQVALLSAANVKSLETAVTRWENYLDHGYSQMPWEAALNGLLIEPPKIGPPDHQWVFLHPTLGVEFAVDPIEEARVKESLNVEVLGHIWYSGCMLDDYWGVSATVSLRDDLDPGIGAMVHIRRNWSVGLTWRDVDEDPFIFLSFDLFGFARKNASTYLDKYESVRSRLGFD